MKNTLSLRARLTLIILLPLTAVAIGVGVWQIQETRVTAVEVYDRSLLSAALAVANDVGRSDGDALSPETNDLLENSSGGLVFYHVYAPDGVIVSGYATPPVGIDRVFDNGPRFQTFEASYQGRPVYGVRLRSQTEVDGFIGQFTTTVWQDEAVRKGCVTDLVTRSALTVAAIMVSLVLIVWFGVRVGLGPLLELEDAIERRSSDDLSPIKRRVPEEVQGIVNRLNTLFGQVSETLDTQTSFIANAAHQIRNPIAGVQSLTEATLSARSDEDRIVRAQDLLQAVRELAQLNEKLLLHERAASNTVQTELETFELSQRVEVWVRDLSEQVPNGVNLTFTSANSALEIEGDAFMLREALSNLIDNAIKHGGPDLSEIGVVLRRRGRNAVLSVEDNGVGIPRQHRDAALERFTQVGASSGSGLGLPIAKAVAAAHGGRLDLRTSKQGGIAVDIQVPSIWT